MRLLPIVLIVLLVVLAIALGLQVMWSAPTGSGGAVGSMPAVLGGKPQGHVYTGVAEEPADVNPFTAHGNAARSVVLRFTHDTLLDRCPDDGKLRPALAEQYEVSADGTTCTFTLRAGVEFSDGTPLTMADVLFGWQLAQAGHLPLGHVGAAFERIDGLDVLDDRRFRVHFLGTHFAAVGTVGEAWIVGNKQFFVERVRGLLDDGEALPAVDSERFAVLLNQIDRECGPGTGPYVLHNDRHNDPHNGRDESAVSNWHRRQDMLLVRHEACWRRELVPGTWNFGGIRTLFREQAGATNELLRGALDWYYSPTLDELLESRPELKKNYRKLVYDFIRLGCYRIVWNCNRKPFDSVSVRRALGMLINRDEILRMFAGAAKPAVAHAKIGSDGYPMIEPLPFDPSAARRLLREAGFDPEQGKPLRVTLLALQGNEPLRRMRELFIGAARQAGIELDVRPRQLGPFLSEKKVGDWDGLLVMQSFDTSGDPYAFLHSDGLNNDGHWQHEDADRLAEAAQNELDAGQRAKMWRELHQLAHEEQPVALIVHPLVSVLLNAQIQDAEPGPLGLTGEKAWVAPEFQRR